METKHIKVDQWPLSDLISDVARGKLRIPQFQRDFVWERTRVIKLLDSMYKDFPIGSFFFWVSPKEYNIFYRDIPDLEIRHSDNDTELTFILDGQQRITSLYSAIKGLKIGRANYYEICFDLDKEIFLARKGDHIRFIPFKDIMGENNFEIYNKLENDARKKNFQRCREKFNNYPFSIIIVKDKNIEQVCEIFERLNQGGKRLDLFDLVVANTWDESFKLKEEIEEANKQFSNTFEELANEIFVQTTSLIKNKHCNRAYQLQLKKEDFRDNWKPIVESIKKSVDYMKNNLGVKTFSIIPYPGIIPLIAYFYYHSKTMTESQNNKIREWFWRCAFSERYSSSTLTRMSEDRAIFDKIISNETVSINYPVKINYEKLLKTTIGGKAALKNAVLCLLAKKNPVSFKDNTPIILDKDYLSSLNSPEKHHIFPKKILDNKTNKEVNTILNFCFIPSSLNKEITKRKPSEYFKGYKKENNKFEEAVKDHLIPIKENSAIWADNYDSFLKERAELILKEIEKLVGHMGELQEELEENPGKVLNIIENRLREVIHINLYENFGENYWETKIPQDVSENIDKRIKDLLKRQPFLKEEYQFPQKKLMLCDFMDYPKIILKNWLVFEDEFGSKEELEKHFKNLKEFRNAIAHSKEMNTITKKEGEVAIEWFSKSLEYKESEEENEHEESENELFERLKEKIFSLNNKITTKQNKYYLAFKVNDNNFLSVKHRKDSLLLYLQGNFFDDSKGLLRNVKEVGHHGTGAYEVHLSSITELDDIFKLIKQAYEQISKKG